MAFFICKNKSNDSFAVQVVSSDNRWIEWHGKEACSSGWELIFYILLIFKYNSLKHKIYPYSEVLFNAHVLESRAYIKTVGSRAEGTFTADSDRDILEILDANVTVDCNPKFRCQ